MSTGEYPTRMIMDGQQFKLDNYYYEKSRAKARIKSWRSRGYKVRIIPRGDRFAVYISVNYTKGRVR